MNESNSKPIYRGDDTGAFGGSFIKIELDNPNEFVVTKAVFQCASVQVTIKDPEFPLEINLTRSQTKQLKDESICYLMIYDEDGLRTTCEGSIVVNTKEGVVNV